MRRDAAEKPRPACAERDDHRVCHVADAPRRSDGPACPRAEGGGSIAAGDDDGSCVGPSGAATPTAGSGSDCIAGERSAGWRGGRARFGVVGAPEVASSPGDEVRPTPWRGETGTHWVWASWCASHAAFENRRECCRLPLVGSTSATRPTKRRNPTAADLILRVGRLKGPATHCTHTIQHVPGPYD